MGADDDKCSATGNPEDSGLRRVWEGLDTAPYVDFPGGMVPRDGAPFGSPPSALDTTTTQDDKGTNPPDFDG